MLWWWATNSISPWTDEVVRSKVEQLIVEGVTKAGKEGSVCQAAGWGYPWLTALPLCPASSITVNEIPSFTQLSADTQWRETDQSERGLNCVFIFYQPVFTFLHSLSTFFFILKWKYISTPVPWAKPVPPCILFLSDILFFLFFFSYLNYFFISYLTLSTLFSTLTGEGHHPSPAVLHTQSGHQLRYRTALQCVTHMSRWSLYALHVTWRRTACDWAVALQLPAGCNICEVLFAPADVCLCLSWEDAAARSHFHTSGWVILTQQPPVTHFPLVVWPCKYGQLALSGVWGQCSVLDSVSG